MVYLEPAHAPSHPGSPQPVGRYLYIGVGAFGGEVVRRLKASLQRDNGELPPLTEIILVDESVLSANLQAGADRCDIHQAFLQPAVTDPLRDTFYESLERCAAMLPMGKMPAHVPDAVRVYLVADLAEPFGSAVILDVARALHIAAGPRPKGVVGLFRFCPKPSRRAGTFAALREVAAELRRLGEEQSGLSTRCPHPCFDRCFLIGNANKKGEVAEAQQASLFARLLARFLRTGLAGIECPVGESTPDERSRMASAGVASAYFPRRALRSHCAAQWCKELCVLLTATPREMTEAYDAAETPADSQWHLDSVASVNRMLDREMDARRVRPGKRLPPKLRALDKAALARTLQGVFQEVLKLIAEVRASVDTSVPLHQAGIAVVREVRNWVETHVGGIARAGQQLDRLRQLVQARVSEAESQHRLACEDADGAIAALREDLCEAASCTEPDPSRKPKPPWYSLVGHWRRWRAIRDTRRDLRAWHDGILEQIGYCAGLARQRAVAEAVVQSFQELENAIVAEQDRLQHLSQELSSIPAADQWSRQGEAPEALVVDRTILPANSFDGFYQRFASQTLCEVTPESVAHLLESEALLSDYHERVFGAIAERLHAVAAKTFRPVEEMPLAQLLEIANLVPRHLALAGWLSHDLWDYAEPLTKVNSLASGDRDRVFAEFSSLQVPTIESLGHPPDPWPYGPTPPSVIDGSDCSVHLCRVQQGFPLSSLNDLAVCREAHQAVPDRRQLYTVDNPDDLPEL